MDKELNKTPAPDPSKDNKDPDDLIHAETEEIGVDIKKQDPDEAVHKQQIPLPPSAEMDIDDLLHQPGAPEPEH